MVDMSSQEIYRCESSGLKLNSSMYMMLASIPSVVALVFFRSRNGHLIQW